MSIKLRSASRVTPQNSNPERFRLEVMKTRRSSQLGKMMTYFRNLERSSYFYEDLMHLGIAVVCLPEADMLLTNEGPFRPHCSFGPVSSKNSVSGGTCATCAHIVMGSSRIILKQRGLLVLAAYFPGIKLSKLEPPRGYLKKSIT